MSTDAIGIVGTDGYTPLYRKDAAWEMWSIEQIYLGGIGLNKFIPKIKDFVVEPDSGNLFKVASLDLVTYIPELVPISIHKDVTINQIIGMSPGNHRIYYDRSISPATLAVDAFMRVYGSANSYARIYKGEFIDPARVISRRYNNSGTLIGNDIPLELTAFNSHDNYAIKNIPTCNTDAQLVDGEVCTVVTFDSSGKVLARTNCIVDETTYVSQAFAEQKYISAIFLKSAFISDTNESNINFPVNLNIQSFNPIGVVQYNDGSQQEYAIDGDKFSLFGLEDFTSTVISHRVPLSLQYRLGTNEVGLSTVNNDGYHITKPYDLIVSTPNTSYSVKLLVYPVWVDSVTGYKLKAFLTNLDRSIVMEVTNHLTLASNSPALNPIGYGITQRLIFSLNLGNVSSIFNYFIHTQIVDIVLRAPAHDPAAPTLWEVSSQVPSVGGFFGTGLAAKVDAPTRRKVYIDSGIETVEEFINRMYKVTFPVYNPITETAPLTPTHVEVSYLNEKILAPIENFKNYFQFTNLIENLSNVEVTFIRKIGETTLKLSIASLTVRY